MIFQNNNQNSLIFFIACMDTPFSNTYIFTILGQGSQEFWRLHLWYYANNNRYKEFLHSPSAMGDIDRPHFWPGFYYYIVNVVGDSRHNSLDHEGRNFPSFREQCSPLHPTLLCHYISDEKIFKLFKLWRKKKNKMSRDKIPRAYDLNFRRERWEWGRSFVRSGVEF